MDWFVSSLTELLARVLVLFTAITVHEYAHGYAAYKLGDPTAKYSGRLSLNPLSHLDPIGALCMVFFRFGWAKPVPINPMYFKDRKRDSAITAAAGPIANILLAFSCSLLIEITQYVTRLGKFQVDDIFNNVLGMLIGYGIGWCMVKVYKRKAGHSQKTSSF